eukprot:5442442-Prymnesium_polylepis.1
MGQYLLPIQVGAQPRLPCSVFRAKMVQGVDPLQSNFGACLQLIEQATNHICAVVINRREHTSVAIIFTGICPWERGGHNACCTPGGFCDRCAVSCHLHGPKARTPFACVAKRASLCKAFEQLVEGLKSHAPVMPHRPKILNVGWKMACKVVLWLEQVLTIDLQNLTVVVADETI